MVLKVNPPYEFAFYLAYSFLSLSDVQRHFVHRRFGVEKEDKTFFRNLAMRTSMAGYSWKMLRWHNSVV